MHATNYKSATNVSTKAAVEQAIVGEIAEGNYVISKSKPTIVSALGAIPKPDSPDVRLIHDCSRPQGRALNDYMSTRSFKFQTLDDAIQLLRPNYFMAKIDLRHAYRSVPIHPSNFPATGLHWHFDGDDDVTYFYDTRLPFGAKSSPEIFHRLTQSVRRMMSRRGFNSVVVYLDDFLVIAPTREACQLAFTTLLQLLQDLGFSISWHKVLGPTQNLVFLGVELDTKQCTMSLPSSKLQDLHQLTSSFLTKRRATKTQLQQLAGKLNWACRVVYGGRTFLRRILDMMNSLSSPTAKARLSTDFYEDIKWWNSFLQVFNGQRPFLSRQPITDVDTDACQLAAGAYYRGDWLYHHFRLDSPPCAGLHINHKEVLAQVFAAFRWGHLWKNHHVIIHCDNVAAVHIINKGTTAHPLVMFFLRQLFWLSVIHNFRFTAVHIKGDLNTIADSVSRLHQLDKCLEFYTHLLQDQPHQQIANTPLAHHMSLNSCTFLLSRFPDPELAKALEDEIYHYRFHTFAANTKASYRTHRASYLRFCSRMGYPPFPAQSVHLCQYAAFLARSLKPSSIPNYLNIIGLLHKEFNLPNPITDNWPLQSLLTGIQRVKGEPPYQKAPITPDLLLQIYPLLNMRSSFDASFWAICLVSFFGMLRKSHLLAKSSRAFDPAEQLLRSDFQFHPWGSLITLRWSKTIQFRERVVQLPLPLIPGSPLCPVTAIKRAMSFTGHAVPSSQAFLFLSSPDLQFKVFTYSMFLRRLRSILQSLGLPAREYACHSFRRGGASFAFQAGSLWSSSRC